MTLRYYYTNLIFERQRATTLYSTRATSSCYTKKPPPLPLFVMGASLELPVPPSATSKNFIQRGQSEPLPLAALHLHLLSYHSLFLSLYIYILVELRVRCLALLSRGRNCRNSCPCNCKFHNQPSFRPFLHPKRHSACKNPCRGPS
jgi:hypothetical protein